MNGRASSALNQRRIRYGFAPAYKYAEFRSRGIKWVSIGSCESSDLKRTGLPRYSNFAGGATDTPRTPALSIAWATKPEVFTSSMNARRYAAPSVRPF